MNGPLSIPRYNQPIPDMRARTPSGPRIGRLRLDWLTSLLLTTVLLSPSLNASSLTDAARQLAHKVAAAAGPSSFALELTNRSSLDDKSASEVRVALEGQLHAEGVRTTKTDQAPALDIVLSESLREYVWTAEFSLASGEKKVAFVSLPRSSPGAPSFAALPLTVRATRLFTQEQPMLDVALVEISGGQRLLVLDAAMVAVYRQPPVQPARWELETALPIVHSRPFPRDLRGRLLLRHDHLFDAYLPGVVCRSNSSPPLALTCAESAEPWPLSSDDSSPRAFFAASRNFFTGALSPSVGRIANVPSFYSAAPLLRPNDSLWAFAGVEGALHLVDGNTDQVVRGKWGSSVASVRSGCGLGAQLLVSENGDSRQDGLRALEIPDRDPVASALADLQGRVSALWTETSGSTAIAISRRKDTGWYEAYRVSVSCGN